ncbi:hypothetical protein LTR78_010374 [Recurvomyces mirabilis]|uniref:Uncharacterized protein n=1 Tax=Recurvomyces mirabilis TaxID=574656 RepID=A0AAE0TPV2_9PEZI|nr:hypothetical protein LTR78_010374 [Recurvomyces mirabilis]KAK5150108.1 hypothetical protein LTS14_010371 [Recurvomyces mirabilis]
MKHSEVLRKQYINKDLNRLTITDLLGLFPRPNDPSNPILSPLTRMGLPSVVGDTSGFVSREEKDVQKRRLSAKALLEGHGSTEILSTGSRGSPTACVAESDLPHLAQNDTTRPTTGMRDGCHDCDASTCNAPAKEKHPSRVTGGASTPRSRQCCGASGEAVHNQAVQDHVPYNLRSCSGERSVLAGQMLGARNDTPNGAMAGDAADLSALPSSIGQYASELGPSQLQRPKVSSRSSLPGDLRTTLLLEQDNVTGSYGFGDEDRIISIPLLPDIKGPIRPTRRVQAKSSILREDTSDPQSVRSDLIGSTSDLSSPAVARRATLGGDCDPFAAPIGKTKGSLKLAIKRSSGHAESQSLKTLGYGDRTASELTSRFPTDALYMTAVTEQEMALLVMMRYKRAVMKKISSAEGLDLL